MRTVLEFYVFVKRLCNAKDMNTLREKDVGITEFVGNAKGFVGIVKLRCQDFLVNEVSSCGKVVHLTTFDPPPSPDKNESEKIVLPSIVDPADNLLLMALDQNTSESPNQVLIKVDCDKTGRAEIHKAIRCLYPNLESSTVDDTESGNKIIKVCRSKSGDGHYMRKRHEKKTYCRFVLHKQNIATSGAINLITSKLSLKHPKAFQYAGNKDKQGITVQEITTSLPYHRLAFLTKQRGKLTIGNFSLGAQPLSLGDLSGNYFAAIVRNIRDAKESDISCAVQSFEHLGFINYFGMQRFGSTSLPTYEIGKSILKKKWDQAVDQILSAVYSGLKGDALVSAKGWREAGKATKILKTLDRKHSLERLLLQGIQKYGTTQLVQALTFMPRNVRTMYLHSYQSLVWNKAASRRIRHSGLQPVVGDLVLLNSKQQLTLEDDDSGPPTKKRRKDNVIEVKHLEEDDLSSYSINDVVLPLPGFQITYPGSGMNCWYEEILKEDDIQDTDFDHRVKEYRLPGAYRKLIVKPDMVEWNLVNYQDYEAPLLVSDLERMEGKTEQQGEDGPYRALRIKFSLPTSCYATMALREVLKQDLSPVDQLALSDQHKNEVREYLAKQPKSDPQNA